VRQPVIARMEYGKTDPRLKNIIIKGENSSFPTKSERSFTI